VLARRSAELAARTPSADAPARAVALLEELARTGGPVHRSASPAPSRHRA
jgi:hypothetical protein